VTKIICSIPASIASSTAYWISGRSTIGQHLLGKRLGRREEAGAEPAHGKHRLADAFHCDVPEPLLAAL
jgi:hypothetical protein